MGVALVEKRLELHRFERALRARMRKLLRSRGRPARVAEGGRDAHPTIIIGASGGPDSTALLVGLAATARSLGVGLTAAHLDHGLRGDEARADRDFVLKLATQLGCRFEEGKAPPLETQGRGIEAAAREARYEFLLEVAERLGAGVVVVAHTATDQAETVLLRILRGAGLRGLAAMPESRRLARGAKVRLVRPLLDVSRDEVVSYLADKGIEAREDAMNSDTRFARVRVRLEILPRAADLVNPAAEEALGRVARAARQASRALEKDARALLRKARRGDAFDREKLAGASEAVLEVAFARLLRRLTPEKVARVHVRALVRLVRSGRGVVALPDGLSACCEGTALLVSSSGPPPRPSPALRAGDRPPARSAGEGAATAALSVPGRVVWAGQLIEAHVVPVAPPPRGRDRVYLDLALAKGALAVRGRRAGDRFVPLGSSGATTLKRFFIDRKIPRALRSRIPIVTLDDLPIWVVGERIDDRMKVTAATRDVLELRVSPADAPGDPT